jgi:hypothetical protein
MFLPSKYVLLGETFKHVNAFFGFKLRTPIATSLARASSSGSRRGAGSIIAPPSGHARRQ